MNLRILRHLLPQGFVLLGEPILFPLLLVLAFIWFLPHTPVPSHVRNQALTSYSQLPAVKLDLHPQHTYLTRFPSNKTALYFEPRKEITHIVPLLLHMLEIIPPDWRVLFVGSEATTSMVDIAGPHGGKTRRYIEQGRLRTVKLEDRWAQAWGRRWDDLDHEEMRSRLLTNRSFYEEELRGTEHLFLWSSESILCGNSGVDLDAWLEWDWVGAPWTLRQKGSSGGFSLRRVSRILQILNIQSRDNFEAPEDQWFGSRVSLIPNVKLPDKEVMKGFAVEAYWHDEPMGYLVHHRIFRPEVWEDINNRRKIFEYCPEIKIVLDMKLSRERCPEPSSPPPPMQPEVVEPVLPSTELPEVQTPPVPPPELEALVGSKAPMEEDGDSDDVNDQDGDEDEDEDDDDGDGEEDQATQ